MKFFAFETIFEFFKINLVILEVYEMFAVENLTELSQIS